MNTSSDASSQPETRPSSNSQSNSLDLPRQRVVILGASNVIRNVSTVVATTEQFRGEPLDFLAAIGHGRSYGLTSRVLGRALPAINTCAIWDALAKRPRTDTVSLVTDVGNDLLYGASVELIATWVEQCLSKLREISDRVILTELPLENIDRLFFLKFFLFRSILFPQSRLTLSDACEMAGALNERIKKLAADFDAKLIKPELSWYGTDPIHIHRRQRDRAWQKILQSWRTDETTVHDMSSRTTRIPLRKCRPHARRLWGFEQRRAQPSLHLPSGTQISLF